jgi:eukaryotic-like serine/threonine-protein kinase
MSASVPPPAEDPTASAGRAAWRRRLAAAAAVALLLALALVIHERSVAARGSLCGGAPAHLAGVWDARRKVRIEVAFLRTGLPFAESAWAGVERTLDRYTADWEALYREGCEATRVRGEPSKDLLAWRMSCLDQRLGALRALSDRFADADPQVIAQAVAAAQALPALAGCSSARLPSRRLSRFRLQRPPY